MKSQNIKLFSYFRSSCSYRVRIALFLKNIPFEYVPVHLLNDGGEHKKSNYSELNPMQQVPFFIHNEVNLAQSFAIIEYIDHVWPNTPLLDKDIAVRAKQVQMAELINSGIQPLQNLSVMQKLEKDFQASKEAQTEWSRHWIQRGLVALEKELLKTSQTYSFGNEVSIVDAFLIPQIYNAQRFNLDMNQYPTLNKIHLNCCKLDAFKKAHPDNQPDTPK